MSHTRIILSPLILGSWLGDFRDRLTNSSWRCLINLTCSLSPSGSLSQFCSISSTVGRSKTKILFSQLAQTFPISSRYTSPVGQSAPLPLQLHLRHL